jgi:hypothetical protein
MIDDKDVDSKSLDALTEELEKEESEELFRPPSVQVIVNIGGAPAPDEDDKEKEKAELSKMTGGK